MQLDSKNVYLLLGSNLGDRSHLISQAAIQIGQHIGIVFAKSSIYETAAWGKEDQPAFLNMAMGVKTAFSPLQILEKIMAIELRLGRVRHEKWGSRLIDIDIILFDDIIIDIEDQLQIPHPQMHKRKFVLEPLAEIAAESIHPILNKTVSEILESLTDNLAVSKI